MHEFYGNLSLWRSELNLSGFTQKVKQDQYFQQILEIIQKKTEEWAKSVGLLEDKTSKKEESLSPEEIPWKEFFDSNSFQDPEVARAFAHMINILTGVKASKFMRIPSKGRRGVFPRFIALIPVGNDNSHNYKNGVCILSYDGVRFLKPDGNIGNDMTSNLACLRVPDTGEITTMLATMLYRSNSLTELIVSEIL